jgi:hypothetical protein
MNYILTIGCAQFVAKTAEQAGKIADLIDGLEPVSLMSTDGTFNRESNRLVSLRRSEHKSRIEPLGESPISETEFKKQEKAAQASPPITAGLAELEATGGQQ